MTMFLPSHSSPIGNFDSNMNGSLAKLVELSKSVALDYLEGRLTAALSYEDFMQQVKNIPQGVDFSKVAKDHRKQRVSIANTLDTSQENVGTIPLRGKPSSANATNENIVDDMYDSWKLQQLKAECEKYGLPKSGKKEDLVQETKQQKTNHNKSSSQPHKKVLKKVKTTKSEIDGVSKSRFASYGF